MVSYCSGKVRCPTPSWLNRLNFSVRLLMLSPRLWLLGTPVLRVTEPLKPRFSSFLSTMLIIPAVPSASYLSEGLVITSMRSIMSAVRVPRALPSLLASTEGLPLIKICTPATPRSRTCPSMVTFTDGTLLSTSRALAPALLRSCPTLNTRRSSLNSVCDRSPRTSTSSSVSVSSASAIVPR